ncbi:FliM/FliN family flagellar motor switch protein [Planctellipticum variicoloris]|uniref:FliM/FliN family flagellar motor switch protein n=1 Tax=Planctellipticum variicoloris TaxID=3064265 RepID=UPI002CE91F91|nr:FliM/FliN family flagellar motor switch protein [Planctomycetaceae bacterium SH412]HTN04236.1 FliM/FliN family flagellar motor switch protein [Planctomycetaceae bacterium]
MSHPLTEQNIEAILERCQETLAGLAESLNQCFDLSVQIEAGESGCWLPDEAASEFQGPGAVAVIAVGDQALGVIIPAGLPLPGWYTRPGENEKSRLDTLAMEWSLNMLPEELEAGQTATFSVPSGVMAIARMQPEDWAATLDLIVRRPDGSSSTTLKLVWPLTAPVFAGEAPPPAAAEKPRPASPASPAAAPTDKSSGRIGRLSSVPVQISVLLAEKRIPMGQMLSITPGALITFNKSCEDLLDLYVNNSLYCRGEAVKIGENFGIKINQVGAVRVRPGKVIDT